MKVGVDLTSAPHVYLALVGKFKDELGICEHLVAVASTTISGVEVRWWLEQLIRVREEEGQLHGPASGNADGSLGFMSENYSFFRTFRKTVEDRTRAAHLDSNVQNAMNR